jgi:S-adenosylmethionine decarboxylase
MFKYILFFVSIFVVVKSSEYEFVGHHLVASYYECDKKALTNVDSLKEAMLDAIRKSQATILDVSSYEFKGGGFSMIVLLSESHASIHTYPEYGSCFIDIFTCGKTCEVENFNEILKKYLKPKKIKKDVFVRD